MADVITNEDAVKALTSFTNEKKVPLQMSGVTMVQEVPGSKGMIAASAFMKENNAEDLKVCAYILRFHTFYPNLKDMSDEELDDLVGDMHYKDVAAIILAFFMDIDLSDEEDRETLEQVFRDMGKDEPSSTSPESTDSP